MLPLTPDDLIPLDEFARRRAEFFAAHQRYLDRYRRVRVGPRATLVFENRQTLWFRLQDVLRVARLAEPERVRQELDCYNQLLPAHGRLQAALVLAEGDGGRPDWTRLTGEGLRLCVEDAPAVSATLITCRPEDRCIGLAHWVEFACDAERRAALADARRPAWVELACGDDYRHASGELSEEVRQSLLDDLTLSDEAA
jgi:hypothetical protein